MFPMQEGREKHCWYLASTSSPDAPVALVPGLEVLPRGGHLPEVLAEGEAEELAGAEAPLAAKG
jgi:hypothetical protein